MSFKLGKQTAIAATAVTVAMVATSAASAAIAATSSYDLPDFPLTAIGPVHDSTKPNIVVIDAGGTLSWTAEDRISYLHYGADGVPGGVQQILEDMYPELGRVANLSVAVSPGGLGSSGSVTSQTLYEISREVDFLLADPSVDGVVVTAGTSVLEEDAYFLDLTVQSQKPVVVTGSMHQYGTFTYDGYTNLFSSIRLAASEKTTCYGTVVLFNDQFFSARDVTKTDGYRMDTFGTRNSGPLGVVNEDFIRTMGAPARVMACGTEAWKTPFDLSQTSPDQFPKVDIVDAYIEASAETVTGPVAGGARGIVTAGVGPGGLSSIQSGARETAIDQGVLFVSASRTLGEGTYDTETAGNIGAGDLLPQKARLLLQLGLTFSTDQEQIRTWFDAVGNAQFDLRSFATPAPTASPEPTTTPEPTTDSSASPTPTATSAAVIPIEGGSNTDGGLAITGGLGVAGGLIVLAALLMAIGALTVWRSRIAAFFSDRRLVGRHH